MRICRIAVFASVLALRASAPALGQSNGTALSMDGRLGLGAAPLGVDGRPAVLSFDVRAARACARGEAAGRVAQSMLIGTAAGAGLALGYVLIRCVPVAAAGEYPRCGGGVPIVLMGSGAVVGLVAGLVSPRCKSRPGTDPQV